MVLFVYSVQGSADFLVNKQEQVFKKKKNDRASDREKRIVLSLCKLNVWRNFFNKEGTKDIDMTHWIHN